MNYLPTPPNVVNSGRILPAGTSPKRRAQAALVARARKGENAALNQIFTEHRGRIERLAQSIVKDPMDAEEVVQDVLLTVSAKLDRFRGDSSLSTWIHRIAVNAALMHRRHRRAVTVPATPCGKPWAPTSMSPPVTAPPEQQHPFIPCLIEPLPRRRGYSSRIASAYPKRAE